MRQTEVLELFDLDGTCNEEDLGAVCEGRDMPPEIEAYLIAAAEFLNQKLGISTEIALSGIKEEIKEVFPKRSKHEFWGTFPSANGQSMRICPAVDHYLLTPHAVEAFLNSLLATETPQGVLSQKIQDFFRQDWRYPLYKFCSAASLPYASIDPDAVGVLESRMSRGALAAIFTNSATSKAEDMLDRVGIKADRRVINGVERGKIGVIGNGRKFEVDTEWSEPNISKRFGDHLDLSSAFGEPGVVIDLRRRHFHRTTSDLMESSGARSVWMASDIAELDLFPLMNWRDLNPRVVMRTNSTSSQESIGATCSLLNARVGHSLSSISDDLE